MLSGNDKKRKCIVLKKIEIEHLHQLNNIFLECLMSYFIMTIHELITTEHFKQKSMNQTKYIYNRIKSLLMKYKYKSNNVP